MRCQSSWSPASTTARQPQKEPQPRSEDWTTPALPWTEHIEPGHVMPDQGLCQHSTCSTLLQHNYPGYVGKCQMGMLLLKQDKALRSEETVLLRATHHTRRFACSSSSSASEASRAVQRVQPTCRGVKCLAIKKMMAPARCQCRSFINVTRAQPTTGFLGAKGQMTM